MAPGDIITKMNKEFDKSIRHLRMVDPKLAKIIKQAAKPTMIWEKKREPFEALCFSIMNQQLAGAAAAAIYKRFCALYGGKNPTPAQLLKTRLPKLRACGISGPKAMYLKDLAKKVSDNSLEIHKLSHLDDEKIIAELTQVKGIGRWTAEMFLMFTIGRLDVFPVGDLGIRNGMKELYGLKGRVPDEKLVKLAEKWRPYRSIGSWYIWQYKDGK